MSAPGGWEAIGHVRTTAIMQPYFLPYLGYFQLIAAADVFVVYDTVKYTKRGWINRNRLLRSGEPAIITLPLQGAPDHLDVRDRTLASTFRGESLLGQVRGAYQRAPYFEPTFRLLEEIVGTEERNLFRFLDASIRAICRHLGVATDVRRSSDIPVDPALRAQDRVIAICSAVGTDRYVNASGGVELYDPEAFAARGIELRFIRPRPFEYEQFGAPFVPQLSILDVLMFNPVPLVSAWVHTGFDLA